MAKMIRITTAAVIGPANNPKINKGMGCMFFDRIPMIPDGIAINIIEVIAVIRYG